jgi:hypothetical protein
MEVKLKYSRPQQYVEVRCQFNATAIWPPKKEPRVPIGQHTPETPELVWTIQTKTIKECHLLGCGAM